MNEKQKAYCADFLRAIEFAADILIANTKPNTDERLFAGLVLMYARRKFGETVKGVAA